MSDDMMDSMRRLAAEAAKASLSSTIPSNGGLPCNHPTTFNGISQRIATPAQMRAPVSNELKKRKGMVRVSRAIMESDPLSFMRIMANILVLRAECRIDIGSDVIEYWGMSPFFDELEDELTVPEYTVTFTDYGHFKFERSEVVAVRNRMLQGK